MRPSLLPPNATLLERALEAGTARLGDIDAPFDSLWDPATMPIDDLPFLAWGLSVDSWDPDWPEAVKRKAVADSIALHRIKGTRLSVEIVLDRFDSLAQIVEWHQAVPVAAPHTFEIIVPMVTAVGQAGGPRTSAAAAEAIVREVSRVKPLQEHFTLVQALTGLANVGVQAVARPLIMRRDDMALIDERSRPWEDFLQTEDGEPFEADDASYLETGV